MTSARQTALSTSATALGRAFLQATRPAERALDPLSGFGRCTAAPGVAGIGRMEAPAQVPARYDSPPRQMRTQGGCRWIVRAALRVRLGRARG